MMIIRQGWGEADRIEMRRVAAILMDVVIALGTAYIIAVSARVRMFLPFSPVPVTAQTFTVLLAGALLGRRRATMALGAYLVGGVVGLPFFAGGSLFGPTGGYLLGFVASVQVVGGWVARGWGRRPLTALLALVAGSVVIYAVGLPWLALFVGARAALPLGFFPFIVGDLVKVICATPIVVAVSRRTSGHEGIVKR
jgi:biotin transport system substrate-specific component